MLTDQKLFQNLCERWILDRFSSEAFSKPLQQEDSIQVYFRGSFRTFHACCGIFPDFDKSDKTIDFLIIPRPSSTCQVYLGNILDVFHKSWNLYHGDLYLHKV